MKALLLNQPGVGLARFVTTIVQMPALPADEQTLVLCSLVASVTLPGLAAMLDAEFADVDEIARQIVFGPAAYRSPPFGGVRQKTFDELERSLLEMEEAYTRASGSGDRGRAQQCRNAVIQAKDHARLAARSPKASTEKKAQKEEMIQWMLVWLENPGIFPAWVKLRKVKM